MLACPASAFPPIATAFAVLSDVAQPKCGLQKCPHKALSLPILIVATARDVFGVLDLGPALAEDKGWDMTAAKHMPRGSMWFLAQRARLRGTEPSGDLFGDLEPGHQLLKTDPRRPLDANLKALTDLIEPSDTIVDVGGGAGRMSLPLALRCHSVTNISQRN